MSAYVFQSSIWLSGLLLLLVLKTLSFCGYILTWGQMSLWGGTVISSMLNCVPLLIDWLFGGFTIVGISSSTLNRFFIFHLVFSLIVIVLVIIHFSYLHSICSSSCLGLSLS